MASFHLLLQNMYRDNPVPCNELLDLDSDQIKLKKLVFVGLKLLLRRIRIGNIEFDYFTN